MKRTGHKCGRKRDRRFHARSEAAIQRGGANMKHDANYWTISANRRLSRRSAITAAGGLASFLAVGSLAACSTSNNNKPAGTAASAAATAAGSAPAAATSAAGTAAA